MVEATARLSRAYNALHAAGLRVRLLRDGRVLAVNADLRDALPVLAAAGVRCEAGAMDPPYHLTSIQKRFGKPGSAPAKPGADGAFARASAGFMGQTWDGGDIAHDPATWAAVQACLKPGAYLAACGAPRTYHRMAIAIEDGGLEVVDMLAWLYGSGMVKAPELGKQIDKSLGVERRVVGRRDVGPDITGDNYGRSDGGRRIAEITVATSPEAQQWEGYRAALKPAQEPIVLARMPLDGTTVDTLLAHGCGALNIDACRVPSVETPRIGKPSWGGPMKRLSAAPGQEGRLVPRTPPMAEGRYPANVLHDGSEDVASAFPVAPGQRGRTSTNPGSPRTTGIYGAGSRPGVTDPPRGDMGSAARFYYCAKVGPMDRVRRCPVCGWRFFGHPTCGCGAGKGESHPTVKPVDLMRYLVRLTTPPGGLVLDCFGGTGTTAQAALMEGMGCIIVERDRDYFGDLLFRLALFDAPRPKMKRKRKAVEDREAAE